jgi:hypothetical protein
MERAMYFAYGSNLDARQIGSRRCAAIRRDRAGYDGDTDGDLAESLIASWAGPAWRGAHDLDSGPDAPYPRVP